MPEKICLAYGSWITFLAVSYMYVSLYIYTMFIHSTNHNRIILLFLYVRFKDNTVNKAQQLDEENDD